MTEHPMNNTSPAGKIVRLTRAAGGEGKAGQPRASATGST